MTEAEPGMRTLILGGGGFIGLNICRYLSENRRDQLTIADNFFRGKKDREFQDLVLGHDIEVIEGDFSDPGTFDALASDYDRVYMLAAIVGVDNTLEMPHEVFRVNTALVYNTLEWLRHGRCQKVLYASTSECYAGTVEAFDYPVPTSEDVPLCITDISHPRFTYAVTKMLGESGFLNYAKQFDFNATVVRYHNVYGPRMGFKHVIPHLVQRFIAKEDPFKVYGHDQTRAFCHVSDAVEGTVLAMENASANGEIFHIGTEEEINIERLVRFVGDLFDFDGMYENAPTYPGSVPRRCPETSKARRLLGYSPKVAWEDGIREAVEWYKNYLESGEPVFE